MMDSEIIPNIIAYTYDDSGKPSKIADSSGQAIVFHYNASGKLTRITNPEGKNILYDYDTNGNLKAVTDQVREIKMAMDSWVDTDFAVENNLGIGQANHKNIATEPQNKDYLKYPILSGENNWIWVTPSKRVTSPYGLREGEWHKGIDIGAMEMGVDGDPVWAMADGMVQYGGEANGYGNVIYLLHPESGIETRYGHLQSNNIKTGDIVHQGDTMGNTGDSSGTHLHFEILKNGLALDPELYFSFSNPEWLFTDSFISIEEKQ